MAPPSKHDLAKLYEILGPDYLPDLDTTDSDGDGTMDFFDSDDDNDGIPDWEDSSQSHWNRRPGHPAFSPWTRGYALGDRSGSHAHP